MEPPFNEVLDITNENLRHGQNYRKMYGIEPRYNEPRFSEFLDITNILVVSPQKIRYIEVFDITNPPFNEQIWPVPSDFVKSRFHCTMKERCCMRTTFPKNYVYVLRTTKTRHMVSFIDFYFHFPANF